MPVSIKDIARAAGVSTSTVSRALSDSQLISDDTKRRVKHLAREMHYTPNVIARSLVTQRTHTIGVAAMTLSDPFVAEVVQGIERTAQAHGYSVILTSSNNDPENQLETVRTLQARRVDAIILALSRLGRRGLGHLRRSSQPMVILDSHNVRNDDATCSVGADNEHGGRIATQHLLSLGHERIAYVTGPDAHTHTEARLEGYRQALSEAGIAYDPDLIIIGNGHMDCGAQSLEAIMALPPDRRPTAAFCYNDLAAFGLMSAAQRVGLLVPDDLALVGFDDLPLTRYCHPSLTTVAQPKQELGKRATEMALALIGQSDADRPMPHTVLEGKLIVRESSGAKG